MTTLDEIKKHLIEVKSVLRNEYDVIEIGIFGSFSRGEQTEYSDIDILVDYTKDITLLDIARLQYYLEEVLKHKVDVVPKSCIRNELKPIISNELVSI